MRYCILCISLAFFLFQPTFAVASGDKGDAEFRGLVKEYLQVIGQPTPDEMLESHMQATVKVMEQTGQKLEVKEIEVLKAQLLDTYKKTYEHTKIAYMEVYTQHELTELMEFYKSDLGQMHLKKNKLLKEKLAKQAFENALEGMNDDN